MINDWAGWQKATSSATLSHRSQPLDWLAHAFLAHHRLGHHRQHNHRPM